MRYSLPETLTAAGAKLEFTEAPDPNLADGSTGVGGGYDKFLAEMAEVVNMQPSRGCQAAAMGLSL